MFLIWLSSSHDKGTDETPTASAPVPVLGPPARQETGTVKRAGPLRLIERLAVFGGAFVAAAYMTGIFTIIGKNYGARVSFPLFRVPIDDCLAYGSVILLLTIVIPAFFLLIAGIIFGEPEGDIKEILGVFRWGFPVLLIILGLTGIAASHDPDWLFFFYGMFLLMGAWAVGLFFWILLCWEGLSDAEREIVVRGKKRFWPWLLFRVLVFAIVFLFAAGALGWLQGRDFSSKGSQGTVTLRNGRTYRSASILGTQDGYLRFALKGGKTVIMVPADQVKRVEQRQ